MRSATCPPTPITATCPLTPITATCHRHAFYAHVHYAKRYGSGASGLAAFATDQISGWAACEKTHGEICFQRNSGLYDPRDRPPHHCHR